MYRSECALPNRVKKSNTVAILKLADNIRIASLIIFIFKLFISLSADLWNAVCRRWILIHYLYIVIKSCKCLRSLLLLFIFSSHVACKLLLLSPLLLLIIINRFPNNVKCTICNNEIYPQISYTLWRMYFKNRPAVYCFKHVL